MSAHHVGLAAVLAALVGCGGEASYVCSDEVFAEVRYDAPADCALSRAVTSEAKQVLQSTGAWAHVDLAAVVLVVRPGQRWHSDLLGIEVDGQFTPGRIEVGANREALVHECLHAKDYLEFDLPRLLAPLHGRWATDGRDAAIRVWRASLRTLGLLA